MRSAVTAAILVCSSVVAATANAGQSHYLLARSFDQFTDSKSISPPDLTSFVEATHNEGVSGGPTSILNHAEVNTESGSLVLTSTAGKMVGASGNVSPADWKLAARFEEHIDPGTATGLSVSFAFDSSGMLTTTIPMTIQLSGQIVLDGCRISFERKILPGVINDLTKVENCSNQRGITVGGGTSGVTIQATELRKAMNLEAQIDAVFNYSGSFTGTFAVNVKGNVRVDGVGGTLAFKSPTFGSKASGMPPVTGDAGTSGGTSGSSGASGTSGSTGDDGGAGSSSGGGDSGGCTTAPNGGASNMGTSAASFGLVVAAGVLVQRLRRRRRRR